MSADVVRDIRAAAKCAPHIRGEVRRAAVHWMWQVQNTSRNDGGLAGGMEGSYEMAMSECSRAVGALRDAWSYMSPKPKRLR